MYCNTCDRSLSKECAVSDAVQRVDSNYSWKRRKKIIESQCREKKQEKEKSGIGWGVLGCLNATAGVFTTIFLVILALCCL